METTLGSPGSGNSPSRILTTRSLAILGLSDSSQSGSAVTATPSQTFHVHRCVQFWLRNQFVFLFVHSYNMYNIQNYWTLNSYLCGVCDNLHIFRIIITLSASEFNHVSLRRALVNAD
jgi:hypothetical protein